MTQVLDYRSDTALVQLNKFARLYKFPDYVKSAQLNGDDCVPPDNVVRHFADVRTHQFPIHTKAATWLSNLYYLEKRSEVSPKLRPLIEQRLKQATEYWRIVPAVDELRSKHAALNTDATPDTSYAIVWATKQGQKERRMPLRNALEVKAAAQWLQRHDTAIRESYTFHDRQIIANKVLDKAAEFGVDVKAESEYLEKMAGRGMHNPKKASASIRARVTACRRVRPDIAAGMNKLAEMVESKPTVLVDPNTMGHLAATIDNFDRQHGLLGKYSAAIPSPEDVLFHISFSKAAELRDTSVETQTGSMYSYEQFSKLSREDVSGIFGPDFAKEVCDGLRVDPTKMAELAHELPRPDASALDDLMSGKGLAPLAKNANALGFDNKQWAELAGAIG